MSTFKNTVRKRLTSTQAWVLPKTESAFAPENTWSNADMEPAPPVLWTWTSFTFFAYWCSDLVNTTGWSAVSSFVESGLTWWESILAVLVAGIFLSFIVVWNGIIGAKLHTPFAVTARAPFGPWLAKVVIVMRCVIAIFWNSIVSFQGANYITQILIAIWPSYRNLPNHLPKAGAITSQQFLSFVLYVLIQLPFILIHPAKLKWLLTVKVVTIPIVAIGTMGWCIHKAGDLAGPALRATGTSENRGYNFMSAVTASMGTWITLGCNIGDFSRYSARPTSAYSQFISLPLLYCVTAIFGAISTTCLLAKYNEELWNPYQVIDLWQGSHGGRAAAFFCSVAWLLAGIGTNITANSVSASTDLCALFPKYIDIFRGQILASTVGIFAFAPWKVLASASSFVSFMSSYSVVLAPIAAILSADFYLIKRQRYDVPQLYEPKGIYWYKWGINWRALVALCVAIGPNIPGMGASLSSSFRKTIGGSKYIFMIGDIFGMVVGAFVHVALSLLFPDKKSLSLISVYAQDVLDYKESHGVTIKEAYAEVVAAQKNGRTLSRDSIKSVDEDKEEENKAQVTAAEEMA